MTVALLPPLTRPKSHPPAPVRLTVAEFHEAYASAKWKARRPYLVRGIVWEQGEMNPPHAFYVTTIHEVLRQFIPSHYHIRNQCALAVSNDTDLEPDLAIVPGIPADYRRIHPTTAALVIEVSDTTLFEDSTTKAELYATAGIEEYWILDVNELQLIVLRDPQSVPDNGNAYRSIQTLTRADNITPLAAPAMSIKISELLPS